MGWKLCEALKPVSESDKETFGLQYDIVAFVKVKQAQAIAAKQVELVELHISAKHSVEVETAYFAVVAIPVVVDCAADNSSLRVANESKAQHGPNERNDL